jgi:hypothetical protein
VKFEGLSSRCRHVERGVWGVWKEVNSAASESAVVATADVFTFCVTESSGTHTCSRHIMTQDAKWMEAANSYYSRSHDAISGLHG